MLSVSVPLLSADEALLGVAFGVGGGTRHRAATLIRVPRLSSSGHSVTMIVTVATFELNAPSLA